VHDAALIEKLGKLFNIHNLTLEDILNSDQRAKFEDYDEYVLCVMKMINFNGEVTSEQLSIILLNDMVISFQEYDKGDAFDLIRTRIRNSKGKIRKSGADYLAYCLLDAVVDCYFSVLEKIGDEIETVEEVIAENPDRETMNRLYSLKREMIFLRKAIWPIREMIGNMERSETKLIKPSTDIYLRDVYDHAIRVIDTVETYRDLLSGMMDIYTV
jgi:magnesium transporter